MISGGVDQVRIPMLVVDDFWVPPSARGIASGGSKSWLMDSWIQDLNPFFLGAAAVLCNDDDVEVEDDPLVPNPNRC